MAEHVHSRFGAAQRAFSKAQRFRVQWFDQSGTKLLSEGQVVTFERLAEEVGRTINTLRQGLSHGKGTFTIRGGVGELARVVVITRLDTFKTGR